MDSIFDGEWTSSVVRNGDIVPDGKFFIEVTGGRLEPLSKHDDRPITGHVRQGANFHAITINETGPRRRYKASLIVPEGQQLKLGGFQNLDPDGVTPIEGDSKTAASRGESFDQLQEVWVATKP